MSVLDCIVLVGTGAGSWRLGSLFFVSGNGRGIRMDGLASEDDDVEPVVSSRNNGGNDPTGRRVRLDVNSIPGPWW